MYGISRWRSLWIIWKNDLCGSKKRKNPGRVGFCFAHPQEDRIRTFRFFYFVLLYSVILGLRPCWGADMRGRIVNNIFLMFRLIRIRFFRRRRRFPASALFGSVFCHLLRCLKYNWLICKNARRQFLNWMWRKELLPGPGLVRISSFWTRRNCFFRFGPGSAFSLFKVETVRLLTLIVFGLNDSLHWDAVRIYP